MAKFKTVVVAVLGPATMLVLAWLLWPHQTEATAAPPLPPVLGTSRENLDAVATAARQRLAVNPHDAPAGIRLSEILLRQSRTESDPSHAIEAERVLKRILDDEPGEYSALKVLGAVYLAQHRFRDAVDAAEDALRVRTDDAWTYGVLGDACLELGEYERAFDAYDTMVRLRPDAASYARVAHAHELQGRRGDAMRTMQMAAAATSTHDPESLAWHFAQLGNLYLDVGDLDSASREYQRAAHYFPNHPYARHGLARVAAARGDTTRSLQLHRELHSEAPTPELASTVGDLLSVMGDAAGARDMYEEAERLEREGWATEEPQPAALARMLADRNLKTADAVALAERAAKDRADIHTLDALAFAYYRAGRLAEARAASVRARRTGTADRRILYHAAVIEHALGNRGEARQLVERAIGGHATFDPLLAPAALALARDLGAAVRVDGK